MRKIMSCFFMASIIVTSSVYADVNSDLNSFFSSRDMTVNATSASHYQGQEADYYSAGGLYGHAPNKSLPENIKPPVLTQPNGGIEDFVRGSDSGWINPDDHSRSNYGVAYTRQPDGSMKVYQGELPAVGYGGGGIDMWYSPDDDSKDGPAESGSNKTSNVIQAQNTGVHS